MHTEGSFIDLTRYLGVLALLLKDRLHDTSLRTFLIALEVVGFDDPVGHPYSDFKQSFLQ